MSFERNFDIAVKNIPVNLGMECKPVIDVALPGPSSASPVQDSQNVTEPESEESLEVPAVEEPRSEESLEVPAVEEPRKKSVGWVEELKYSLVIETEESERETHVPELKELKTLLEELQRGIQVSLDKLPINPERDVLMTDFHFIEAINFSRVGPNVAESNYSVNVHAPVAFRYFRDLYGITTEDFKNSICETELHAVNCQSRSGSKFFTTSDDRFVLKTVQKKEAHFLTALFPGYFLNLTQHTKTLLPKYYGLYSHLSGIRTVRVLIMNNILPRRYKFHEKYDIKAATYSKRQFKKPSNESSVPNDVVLKDLDFLKNWPKGFYLHYKTYKVLLRSIERDCKVLESYSIMDYSLLLGIVIPDKSRSSIKLSNSSENLKRNKNLIGPFEARTMKGDIVYLFVGIIDILQSYNWKKKIEYQVKSLFYRSSTISVNNPCFYSQRFQKFLSDHVFKCIPNLVPSSRKECCRKVPKDGTGSECC